VAPIPPADFQREANLARLATESFDLVVIGGGITGAGVALDAAGRGLRTALVEAADLSSGTSSRSSKLVHGGLRYLDQHEYRLVRQALVERQHLLANAPHLVRPLPFVIPLFGTDDRRTRRLAATYSSALSAYDLVGGMRIGRRHRRLAASEALRHVPGLRAETVAASFVYWDAQADDARLTLAVARSAAALGAVVVTRCPVTALLEGSGRVHGVGLADGTEVRAGVVVNAAGVWSEEVGGLGGRSRAPALRPAKGVHLTVPADRLPCDTAVVLPVPGERRSVFVVPWDAAGGNGLGGPGRFTYIGTTDTDYDGPLDDPSCSEADLDGLLATVNHWTTAGLTPADVTGTWAGLRPLLAEGDHRSARSADLSRRHRVVGSTPGLVTVTGGKLTTYRLMAADAVDAALGQLDLAVGRFPTRLRDHRRSAKRRLLGSGRPDPGAAGPGLLGIPSVRRHLLGRYGAEAVAVAELCRDRPELAEPLVAGLPYLRAEAVHAVRREMALTLDDVLARRTRALILDRAASVAAAPEVAALVGAELSWGPERMRAEVEQFAAVAARCGPPTTARR